MGTITELLMLARLWDRPVLVQPANTDRPIRVNEAAAVRSNYLYVAHLINSHFVPIWPIHAAPVIGLGAQPLIVLGANGGLELIE